MKKTILVLLELKKAILVLLIVLFLFWCFFNIPFGCNYLLLNLKVDVTPNGDTIFDFTSDFTLTKNGIKRTNHSKLYVIDVWQIDAKGNKQRECWLLKPRSGDRYLPSLEYGRVPSGWTEEKKAEPLLKGVLYCINDSKVFGIDNKGRPWVFPGNYNELKWRSPRDNGWSPG